MAVADMTLPDGSTRTIRGANRQDVIKKAEKLSEELAAMPEVVQNPNMTFMEFGSRKFLNNLINLPQATGDMLALGAAGLQTAAQIPQDNELGFLDRFRQNFEQQRQQFPASGLKKTQEFLPENFNSIQAAGETAFDAVTGQAQGGIGETFEQNKLQGERRLEALRQQQPFATGAGDVAGDVATLATGRRPVANMKARSATKARVAETAKEQSARMGLSEDAQRQMSDVVTGTILPNLKGAGSTLGRGAGKAAEAGLEGATLAILNEGDPITAGMWSAGAQGVASPGLFLLEETVKSPWKSLGAATLAFSLWQLYGPDSVRVLESAEDSIKKAGAGLALGVAAGAMGAGRVRGQFLEKYPMLADALTSVPRGVALSRLNEMTGAVEDGDPTPIAIMEKFSSNPSFFTPDEQRRLGKAVMSEETGAFRKEVNKMMRSKKFREKIGGLQ